LIAVVLEKAPDKYKSILTAEQRHKGVNLTLSDLNNCMNDLFRAMNPNKVDANKDTEVALSATTTEFKKAYATFVRCLDTWQGTADKKK
jgi:hypothetical protein